jgi:hypothetical protein
MWALSSYGESMVVNPVRQITFHWAPYNHHSLVFKDNMDMVKKSFANSGVNFVYVDESKTPSGILTVPSIIMLDEHGHRSQYHGTANAEKIRNWISDPQRRDFI